MLHGAKYQKVLDRKTNVPRPLVQGGACYSSRRIPCNPGILLQSLSLVTSYHTNKLLTLCQTTSHVLLKQSHQTHLVELVFWIIKVDLKGALFAYTVDEAAKAQAELMDGKLLLATNVPDLTPQEVVSRYKALADIERGFRVLKSEIDIAPVYHRLPQRIRAHAMLCFMALILHRVMRQRLKLAKSELSPDQALAQLRRIQRHSVSINRAAPMVGISTVNTEQAKVLAAFKVKKPDANAQMSLL